MTNAVGRGACASVVACRQGGGPILAPSQGFPAVHAVTKRVLTATTAGAIGLTCGTKYATAMVRVERWSEAPPRADSNWHERDVLPFEPVEEAGPLIIYGFDGNDGELSVDGLGRSRVEVLVRGRYQAWDDYVMENRQPEEWLIRLWPDPLGLDGMAGEPRRLAAMSRRFEETSLWKAACHSFERKGWKWVIDVAAEYQPLVKELFRVGVPVTAEKLAEGAGFDDGLDTPLTNLMPEVWKGVPNNLAAWSGIDSLVTVGDLIEAMSSLGLLAVARHNGRDRLTPNPGAPRPEDVLPLSPEHKRFLRSQGLRSDFYAMGMDLLHLLRWAPDETLVATPFEIALRLGVTPPLVVGGIDFLARDGEWSKRELVVAEPAVSSVSFEWDAQVFDQPVRLQRVR